MITLTPRQLQSVCTLGLLGGIIAISWQNQFDFMILLEASKSRVIVLEHPIWDIGEKSMRWNFILITVMVVCISLIAWGADWLRFKYKGKFGEADVGAGSNQEAAEEAAKFVSDKAADAAEQVVEGTQP